VEATQGNLMPPIPRKGGT